MTMMTVKIVSAVSFVVVENDGSCYCIVNSNLVVIMTNQTMTRNMATLMTVVELVHSLVRMMNPGKKEQQLFEAFQAWPLEED